ncbi:MAG TPA: hypothetical protein VNE86_08155 [Nitrososphaerales archaeon]|nr:hypothetical protein [Nitrososphaerales archaeon]
MAKANGAVSLGVTSLVVIAIIIIVGFGVFLTMMNAGTTTSTITTTSTTTTTTQQNQTQSSNGLELRLSVNATSITSGESVLITASEYNTLTTPNNVSVANLWGVNGLSLGSCSNEFVQPFGVAVFQGRYTTQNLSQATPLRIFPITACPMYVRLVTGYLFPPQSDVAAVLPGGSVTSGTPMAANLTVSHIYKGYTESQVLSPGVYTVVAGDEWGALTMLHFTVLAQTMTTTTSTGVGTLAATVSVGPTQPVCMANSTSGPAPSQYSSIQIIITSSSGQNTTLPTQWLSNGCEATGTAQASLGVGTYTLNLSSCTFMGCKTSLPKIFTITSNQITDVNVSIDTGIR